MARREGRGVPSAPEGGADGTGAPRAATIRDVAARAGVSVATVSRVITGNYPVAAATRTKVMRAVEDLDYVVNAHARALAGTRSKIIAVLLSDITSPFYNRVVFGVEQQAAAENRLVMVCSTLGDPDREVRLVEMLREQNVDAVVLIGGIEDSPEYRDRMARLARLLDGAGSRLVLCGRPSPGVGLPVSVVEYDNVNGAFAATSYLLSRGHHRILFFGGVEVPGEVSVVGYNDEAVGQDVFPTLTTVSIPHMELGREAVRLALHRNEPSAARNQHVMLGTHIVVRDSVRQLIHRP